MLLGVHGFAWKWMGISEPYKGIGRCLVCRFLRLGFAWEWMRISEPYKGISRCLLRRLLRLGFARERMRISESYKGIGRCLLCSLLLELLWLLLMGGVTLLKLSGVPLRLVSSSGCCLLFLG